MAGEIATLATFLDVRLAAEDAAAPRDLAAADTSPPPAVRAPGESGLAPAVLPPPREGDASPGNGRDLAAPTMPHRPAARPATEPLPQGTGSLMLRKGMTMVLEGRLRKKRSYSEPKSRPGDAERMQEKIDRWARSGTEEEVRAPEEPDQPASPKVWPPPLPSSNGD
jgi:hypothetical protein